MYPFAVYNDDEPVGFMLLDEDLEERFLVIWRILFSVEHQNKGYGFWLLKRLFRWRKNQENMII